MTNSTDNLFGNILNQAEDAAVDAPEVADDPNAPEVAPQINELDMLKQRAKLMGISFSPNLKDPELLKAKINAKLAEENPNQTEVVEEPVAPIDIMNQNQLGQVSQAPVTSAPVTGEAIAAALALLQSAGVGLPGAVKAPVAAVPAAGAKTGKAAAIAQKAELRKKLIASEMKLVRLRITNLDPKKKDLPGEIITFANSVLGTVKKYVPFGEATDNGYHVPYCIYKILKRREFLQIRTGKNDVPDTRYVREFALEVLPQLNEAELANLARTQAAKEGV